MADPNYASEAERRISELERQIQAAQSQPGSKGQVARSNIPRYQAEIASLRSQLQSGDIRDPTVLRRAQDRATAKNLGQSRSAPGGSASSRPTNRGVRDSSLQGSLRTDDVASRVGESQRRRALGDLGVRSSSLSGSLVSQETAFARSKGSFAFQQRSELALAREDQERRIAAREEIAQRVGAPASSKFYDKARQGLAKEATRRGKYGVQASKLQGSITLDSDVYSRQALKTQERIQRTNDNTRMGSRYDLSTSGSSIRSVASETTTPKVLSKEFGSQFLQSLGQKIASPFKGFAKIVNPETFQAIGLAGGQVKATLGGDFDYQLTPGQRQFLERKSQIVYDPDVINADVAAGATLVTLTPVGAYFVTGTSAYVFGSGSVEFAKSRTPDSLADATLGAIGIAGSIAPTIRGIRGAKLRLTGQALPEEAVLAPEVLAGKQTFPTTPSPSQALKDFQLSRNQAGQIEVFHATPKAFSKTTNVQAGGRALSGLEDPGLYVTPASRGASPYFLGIEGQQGYTFSLLPDFNLKNPAIVKINLLDVQRQPKSVIRAPDFIRAGEFLESQTGTGRGFITRRSELRQTSEIEAVIPVGTRLVRRPGAKQFTTVKGKAVEIAEYDVLLGAASPDEFARVKSNILKESGSSYPYYTRGRVVTPYSGLSVSTYYKPSTVLFSGRSSSLSTSSSRQLSSFSSFARSSRSSSSSISFSRGSSPFGSSPGGSSSGGSSGGSSSGGSSSGGSSRGSGRSGGSSLGSSRNPLNPFSPSNVRDRTYRFDLDFDSIAKKQPSTLRSRSVKQPTRYVPTLYSIFTGEKKQKGQKVRKKNLTGLEGRPIA